MGFVINEPGCVQYIHYYDTYLAKYRVFRENYPPRIAIVQPTGKSNQALWKIIETYQNS